MPYAYIAGTGMHVPENVVTNDDLTKIYDTSDEWIYERSGIKERRWVLPDANVGPADLAVPAVQMALEDAGLQPQDIDFILFATLSPESYFPGSGCFLHGLMGLETTPALDIRMQCSGFVYGLSIAQQFIQGGVYKNILLVGSEVQSTSLDLSDEGRTVGVLFGDGAGAAVISATEDKPGLLHSNLHAQGEFAEELWVPEPSSKYRGKVGKQERGMFPYMNGREVFKHAVTRMSESIMAEVEHNGWTANEVDKYILHQANARIVQAVANNLNQPLEKFYINITKYGNTTAATLPICLTEATREGWLQRGHKTVLSAFGSGFGWGSVSMVF